MTEVRFNEVMNALNECDSMYTVQVYFAVQMLFFSFSIVVFWIAFVFAFQNDKHIVLIYQNPILNDTFLL